MHIFPLCDYLALDRIKFVVVRWCWKEAVLDPSQVFLRVLRFYFFLLHALSYTVLKGEFVLLDQPFVVLSIDVIKLIEDILY